MIILIFLVVFLSVSLLAYFFYESAIPFLFNRYKQIEEKRTTKFTKDLEESFIFWERKKIIFFSLFPFVFAGVGFFLLKNVAGFILGGVLGLGFPNIMIAIAKRVRLKKFQGQLVDSVMMLSSSIKAGLSFIQAIEVLCEEMGAPISQEFDLVLKENKWGIALEESLRRLRKRVPLEEVNLLVSSILVARESGGDLTKILSRLTETIRNNLKLKEKVSTLTLQGRLQGIIMMGLPFAFTYFIYKQNPEHFSVMLETSLGRMLIIMAVVLQIIGIIMIQRISRVKI